MAGLEFTCRDRLRWPANVKRTPADSRKSSYTFRSGGAPIRVTAAQKRLIDAIDAFTPVRKNWRTEAVEICADWAVGRLDMFLADGGRGRSGDPGVVLSFVLDGKPLTLPCDRYDSVAGNLAAIAAHLEAIRGIERWGVATVEQMLSAHAALPSSTKREWWEVLQVSPNATSDQVEAAYRRLTLERHPDRGGSDAAMAELNVARDEWRSGRG